MVPRAPTMMETTSNGDLCAMAVQEDDGNEDYEQNDKLVYQSFIDDVFHLGLLRTSLIYSRYPRTACDCSRI